MPPALLRRSVDRLRLVSITFCGITVLAWLVPNLVMGEMGREFRTPFQWSPPVAIILASLVTFAIARSRRLSRLRIVTAGLVYQVVVSYCLPITQYWGKFEGMDVGYFTWDQLGFSSVAIWMFFFTVLVPSRPRDALIALALSGAATPITLELLIRHGMAPRPTPMVFFFSFVFPYMLCVLMAYVAAWIIYGLGKDVSRAEEMGSYRLLSCIGRGGMGEVWQANHNLLARPAAVKLIRRDAIDSDPRAVEDALARFEREAQVTASLESPHTVDLYDFGVNDEGVLYYVMEYLEGIDLESIVRRFGPLEAERVVHILLQICHSLEEAHRHGLVHRDIKPANIYLCRRVFEYDFVKVLDFGLVKRRSSIEKGPSGAATVAGSVIGTPSYVAPEVALGGDDVDGRADVYGLGCVAYWLLSGHRVFEEKSAVALIAAHLKSKPEPPSARTEMPIPPALDALVLDCLAKDPADRPETAGELRRRLGEIEFQVSWTRERAAQWWESVRPEVGSSPTSA
jgi:serine/threonine-protein kinase